MAQCHRVSKGEGRMDGNFSREDDPCYRRFRSLEVSKEHRLVKGHGQLSLALVGGGMI